MTNLNLNEGIMVHNVKGSRLNGTSRKNTIPRYVPPHRRRFNNLTNSQIKTAKINLKLQHLKEQNEKVNETKQDETVPKIRTMIIKKRKQVYELTKSMNNNTKKIKEIKEQISKLLSQDNKDNKEEVKDLRKNINELLSENLKIKSELTKLNKQIVEAEYIKEEEQNAYSHFAEYMNNTNEREKEQAQARSIRTASIKPRTRKITNISSLFMRNEPRSIPIIEPRSKPKPRTRKRRGNVVGSILHIS